MRAQSYYILKDTTLTGDSKEESNLIALVHFDFWGSDEELEKLDKACKDAAEKTQGVEYMGRFMPEQSKWHYTNFYKVESYAAWGNVLKNFEYKRDKKHLSHDIIEFYI